MWLTTPQPVQRLYESREITRFSVRSGCGLKVGYLQACGSVIHRLRFSSVGSGKLVSQAKSPMDTRSSVDWMHDCKLFGLYLWRIPEQPYRCSNRSNKPLRRVGLPASCINRLRRISTMAVNRKQTSPRAAKAASAVLRDGRTGKASKTAAASALAQAGKRKK